MTPYCNSAPLCGGCHSIASPSSITLSLIQDDLSWRGLGMTMSEMTYQAAPTANTHSASAIMPVIHQIWPVAVICFAFGCSDCCVDTFLRIWDRKNNTAGNLKIAKGRARNLCQAARQANPASVSNDGIKDTRISSKKSGVSSRFAPIATTGP